MQVPPRLGNQDFLKVGIDATFKDLFGDWMLMPRGVFSKHVASTTLDQGLKGKSWCTRCTPVLYCVTNSDVAVACEHALRAFDHAPLSRIGSLAAAQASKTCSRRDAADETCGSTSDTAASCSHIRQFQADWAKGLDVARRKLCPISTRQGDFRCMFREVQEKLPARQANFDSARVRCLKI